MFKLDISITCFMFHILVTQKYLTLGTLSNLDFDNYQSYYYLLNQVKLNGGTRGYFERETLLKLIITSF